MRNLCQTSGLPNPEFFQNQNSFKVIIRFNRNGGGVSGGVSGGVTPVTVEGLYLFIKENPGKRTTELTALTGLSKRTLERWLKKLKENDQIKFVGSSKTGGYFKKK